MSTSELFKYYLNNNNGDIVQSLWDTTLFTKLAARVNIKNSKNSDIKDASRESAALLSSMFYDEFSSGIPLEWLLEVIPPDDKELNDPDSKANPAWKDFMPVNRAGTPYHIFNLATWAAIMDPQLVEEFTTAYYSKLLTPQNEVNQHGRIKVEADMMAVHQARDMRQLFEHYRKSG